ncbi:hypothetical protein V0U79_03470 [Hyphobacterium sp. HN65]|uniref:Uncharacterized protein n=1 Tax=Hyphobacterium lacteum TaxID=3116575 RepID=A0ABU7LNB0_9PROT|nr:hypothetical protein [Hyphobacterium sp. HN65]MEE2525413.1 hypothetical protein [Hyphobacterium sp. HN65]
MTHAAIERFKALETAFFENTKRSERTQARFAAAACLNADDDPATMVRRALRERDAINQERSGWRSPSTSLRLVYGAALASARKDGGGLIRMMEALETERKRRGGRSLSSGGAPAALVMMCAGGSFSQAGMFYDVLSEISAPWWRRTPASEESYAAIMTATGEIPATAMDRLDKAKNTLRTARVPRSAFNTCLYEVAVADPRTDDFVSAWMSLNVAARQRSGLQRRATWAGLATLAAQVEDGSQAGDALVQADEFVQAHRPRITSIAAGRLTVRLAASMTGLKSPGGAAADYAAVLAAQAAMIAATTAATAAVVAAT